MNVKANPKLAFRYFERAMKSNVALGKFHLARCYDLGIGVSANPMLATRLFKSAAMQGLPEANMTMARRYFEGKGVEADPVAGIGWLTRGAQLGSAEAMVILGERFENGDVVMKDLNRAGQLYSSAAKINDPTGTYKLALMYLKGVGTKADPIRAYVLLNDAQALPAAKKVFDELGNRFTPEQKKIAQQKLVENKNAKSQSSAEQK